MEILSNTKKLERVFSMKDKKYKKIISKILDGNGFYIAVIVCFSIIAVNGYFTLNHNKKPNNEEASKHEMNVVINPPELGTEITGTPVIQPTPKPTAKPDTQNKTASVASVKADVQESVPREFKLVLGMNLNITKEYSGNTLVYSQTLDDWRIHNGIDVSAKVGDKVFAGFDGVVEDITTDPILGITIVIDHNNGYKSVYANLSSDEMVKKGQSVKQGDVISGVGTSAIGETMESTHLHIEVIKNGEHINPTDVIAGA